MTGPGRPHRVLLVQDGPVVVDLVMGYLQRDGILPAAAGDVETALRLVRSLTPDLIVVDVALLGDGSAAFCEQVRQHVDASFVLITPAAQGHLPLDQVVVEGSLTAPVSPRELVQCIRAVLRRGAGPAPLETPLELVAGDLVLDQVSRVATKGGRRLALSAPEFDLLALLMSNPGRVFRRDELFEVLWEKHFEDLASIAVHVHRLREEIEADPAQPAVLVTVWGVGYRLDPRATQ
ncbi:response regulator transcription factor [Saccharopolyspora sp. NPDC000359]|uniref:response regulator transcription factor n=1 Tax=Saccharopolyspora sp. NPDC000359 TaxID=3154251 RepID=UPI0033279340